MAHVLTQISHLTVTGDIGEPVILKGIENFDYIKMKVTTQAANIYIGALVFFTANSVTEVTIGADNVLATCIVLNTSYNQSVLAENNAATTLTRALFFASGATIEVGLIIRPVVASLLISASTALEIGSPIMPGATGSIALGDDSSRNIGHSLVYNTSGTGTDYGAFVVFPAGLTTKT